MGFNHHSDSYKYHNLPLTMDVINIQYSANNIIPERCELYGDFIQSFLNLVFKTYLGDDITDLSEREAHFNWCWDKTIENFSKEDISFQSRDGLYEYFRIYLFTTFYIISDKNIILELSSNRLWKITFDYNKVKTQSDIDNLLEVYNLFSFSIGK